jgi:hypothetical protein
MAGKSLEKDFFRKDFYAFFPNSVLRQMHSLLQSEFSTDCDLVIFLSISSMFLLRYVIQQLLTPSSSSSRYFLLPFPIGNTLSGASPTL